MPKIKSPRKGSLQFWPRKRAKKFLPRVNWAPINSKENLGGFIGYKAGMASAYLKDNTKDSMSKGKNIVLPITLIECPPMKIFSVRLYKEGKVKEEILINKKDKELQRKIKLPKDYKKGLESINKEGITDVRIICYSLVKKAKIKKKPDLTEIDLGKDVAWGLNFVKEKMDKEIRVSEVFEKNKLSDIRGLTKGKGFVGPVKRFGIKLRSHKSEKGVRKVGSIAPWHPARLTYRHLLAGQLGMFSRVSYNKKIIDLGEAKKNFKNIKNYGDINTDYLIVLGSVQGPSKRQLLITKPFRKTKKQDKKSYELIEIR